MLTVNGVPVANATGLTWGWAYSMNAQLTDYGSNGTTDANGNFSFPLINTLLTLGATGYLFITDNANGAADSPTAHGYFNATRVASS